LLEHCAGALLLEDTLVDCDAVYYQTGCATVKHLAVKHLVSGVAVCGCEDAMIYLLTFMVCMLQGLCNSTHKVWAIHWNVCSCAATLTAKNT
jgi:hypothetical protein